jgi:hypothetical protein
MASFIKRVEERKMSTRKVNSGSVYADLSDVVVIENPTVISVEDVEAVKQRIVGVLNTRYLPLSRCHDRRELNTWASQSYSLWLSDANAAMRDSGENGFSLYMHDASETFSDVYQQLQKAVHPYGIELTPQQGSLCLSVRPKRKVI